MKNSILILAVLAYANIATAQTIMVSEQNATYSTGNQNALVTTIYQNSKDEVVSKWKDYLKDFKNEKVKFDNNEMFADNLLIKDWGNNPVDVYTRFEENKDDHSVKMMVAFDLGGAYLTSGKDAAKYAMAEKLVKDFGVKATRFPFEEKIRIAQKLLGNMDGDQKNLEKENKDLHNDIDTYKNKMTKAEDEIKKNEDSQAKKKAQIEAQKTVIEQIKREMEGVK
ncbi:MAG: hypothetical protein ABI855_05240 [Bacteroidota bacterium]